MAGGEIETEREMEIEVEAVRKRDYKGEEEEAKGTQIRKLRRGMNEKVDDPDVVEMDQLSCESEKMGRVDSDAVVAYGQKMKETDETDKDPDVKESEAMIEEDVKGEGEVGGKASAKIESAEDEKMRGYAMYLEWKRKKEAEERERVEDPEKITDPYAFEARMFRKTWDDIFAKRYGSFDENTKIPCKRFTDNPASHGLRLFSSLQVFYVKVGDISGILRWPLEVFGTVALRDSIDHNRNIIFERKRENCQILTDEDPYLILTGPVRAVVTYDPVIFEASLYVKGATRSCDKELSLLATSVYARRTLVSPLIQLSFTSKLSTLELMFGHIIYSVEATIRVQVVSGSWPDGFGGRFVASTSSISNPIVLLDSKNEKVPFNGDEISLARKVVSVEIDEELIVLAKSNNGSVSKWDAKHFKPQKMGSTSKELKIGGCTLEATVYWSCF